MKQYLSFFILALFLSSCGSSGTIESANWYKPSVNSSWHWQLNGKIKMDIPANVYIVDLFDTSSKQVKTLHKQGKKVIAYFSAGSYEAWREDAKSFKQETLGAKMDGWDERWLDIRNPTLRPIMIARIALAKEKGFDGVEADNVDGYTNTTTFKLTAKDQLVYNRFLADEAHKKGLAIALKNDLDQIGELVKDFDFAINEQCHEFDECGGYKAFIEAGKPVFNAEYKKKNVKKVCSKSKKLGLQTLFLPLELDGSFRKVCE